MLINSYPMNHFSELLTHAWLLAAIAALCVGLSKAGLGGFSMLTVLFMAEIMPARASTGVVLPLLIVGDLFAVHAYRRHTQWRYVRRLLVPAVIGIGIGYGLMHLITDDHLFKHVIGWIILGLTVLQAARDRFGSTIERLAHTPLFSNTMGSLGGVSTMMANAAGPVMSLYFLAVNLPKYELLGTSSWFFFIVNLLKAPLSAQMGLINFTSLTLVAMLTPFVVLGLVIGRALIGLVPQIVFEWMLLISAAAGAARLIWG